MVILVLESSQSFKYGDRSFLQLSHSLLHGAARTDLLAIIRDLQFIRVDGCFQIKETGNIRNNIRFSRFLGKKVCLALFELQ